jgi:nicotinamidase-related amidase
MRANTCIESTVRFAAELGYEVTLVKDAIGSFSKDEMESSLRHNLPAQLTGICKFNRFNDEFGISLQID